jgi:agmatinase
MSQNGLGLKEPDPRFAECNSGFTDAYYIFYGIPFDATVSHKGGASKAPNTMRKESYNFETYLLDLGVELEEAKMADIGDLEIENSLEGQSSMIENSEKLAAFILENGKLPLMMGGEHSVSEGPMNAFMEAQHKKGGLIVVLDAHLDFRQQYLDNPHSHASITRRLFERWGPKSICIIGARSGCREEVEEARDLGLRFVTSRQVQEQGIHEVLETWDTAFSIRDRPIYLSIDMDVIDPSFAPGTGTPEPWGLSTMVIQHILGELYSNVQSIDLVEVSPDCESFITPSLAAKLLRQFVGLKEKRRISPDWLFK